MHNAPQIVFASTVPRALQAAVESLFFFNPRQSQRREGIHAAVAGGGMPALAGDVDRVWIEVPPGRTQCLFACAATDGPPVVAGVALYVRPAADTIWITHLAVDPAYAYGGEFAALAVAGRLVDRVAAIARSVKGVPRFGLYDGTLSLDGSVSRLVNKIRSAAGQLTSSGAWLISSAIPTFSLSGIMTVRGRLTLIDIRLKRISVCGHIACRSFDKKGYKVEDNGRL